MRCVEAEPVEHRGEVLAVFRHLDAGRRSPDNVGAVGLEGSREVQRGLPAELHDDRIALFPLVNIEHIFEGQRLEVKLVTCVIVGRNRLRVGVDHDCFPPHVAKSKSGVDAAVVEFDPLPDPIGPAPEDHDPLFVSRPRFILVAVSGIKIGGVSLEFRRASINQSVGRFHPGRDPRGTHGGLGRPGQVGNLPVGKSVPFHAAPWDGRQVGRTRFLRVDDFGQSLEEPRVDSCHFVDARHAPSGQEGVPEAENALGRGNADLVFEHFFIEGAIRAQRRSILAIGAEPGTPGLQRAQRFLHGLFEGASDRHGFADTFHLRGQHRISLGEFFKGEARYLDHAIVNRRFETRGRLARDVIAQLVQRVAHGELGRDFGDREPGSFGGEGRRAGDARVHFDNHHASGFWTDRKLDIRPACLHPDGADHGE